MAQVFGAVEPSSACGGIDLTVFFGFVDTNANGVRADGAGDRDAVVEACPLSFPVLEFLYRRRGVVGLSVDGDPAQTYAGFGDVEVVGAGALFVALR
ncbi:MULTISPECIES: hypothetical protein [unclassified Streptomyces]|uniref:hypothetical protein n=1 Tax=unclassified Streptomyces TaxID=2593676 RepID=UPI00382BD20E